MSSRPKGIQLPLPTHSTQASIRMIRLFVGPPHSHIKSSSHASELQSESTWKGIPLTHSRHACRHSLFTSHNQHRWKNTNCCVKWKVSKNVRASAKEVDAMNISCVCGILRLERTYWVGSGKVSRDERVRMNLAVNFPIRCRQGIYGNRDASIGVSLILSIFLPPLCLGRFNSRRTEHRLLVPHKARG